MTVVETSSVIHKKLSLFVAILYIKKRKRKILSANNIDNVIAIHIVFLTRVFYCYFFRKPKTISNDCSFNETIVNTKFM